MGAHQASLILVLVHILVTLCSPLSIDQAQDSIVITPQQLAKLSGLSLKNADASTGLNIFQQLARALKACGLKSTIMGRPTTSTALTKMMFPSTNNVTCNDGSPAGYYLRRSHGSKRWIIFLEGGWYCFDKKSCNSRWVRMQNLMSSKMWSASKHVGGFLSSDPEENPYWWNANHVFVPYCSSDSWSGTIGKGENKDSFAFMGSYIVEEVIKDLLHRGLFHAKKVYLAGSSAGGTGVILNVDRVADLMKAVGSRADVRGIADSGWFIDNKPFQAVDCVDPHSCAPMDAIKKGIELWAGRVPERCQLEYPKDEHWKCYLGYRTYPSMRAPLFVFQWLFDEAQMAADNVGAPVTKAQWNYIHKMGQEVRKTFTNVSAVFAPSCISHTVLTKSEWKNIQIDGITLPQAIRCWEEQKHEHNHHNHHPRHQHHELKPKDSNFTLLLSDMPLGRKLVIQSMRSNKKNQLFKTRTRSANDKSVKTNNTSRRHKRKRKLRRRKKNRKRRNRNRKRKDRKGNKNRASRSLFRADDHLKHQLSHHKNGCSHRFIEQCSWPQCNPTCPKLHNPFTGEEMDFMELLKSFGLDKSSVASALGINVATLNEMDRSTLLQLLTQPDN